MTINVTPFERILLITVLQNKELLLAKAIQNSINDAPLFRTNLILVRGLIQKLMNSETVIVSKCSICDKEESTDTLILSKEFPYGLYQTCYLNSTAE